MRSTSAGWLLAGLLAAAPVARAGDDPCRDSRYAGDLATLFAAPRELGSEWDSVRESPSDPAEDPDLVASGVLAMRSLHYTRARPGGSEVCSLEIWSFASAAAARRSRAQIEQPAWRVALRGNLLMMSRGVTYSRAEGFRPGLLPECHRLADLTEARAGELLGCSAAIDPGGR
ncbi:MAG TPA: hypothetical protein VII72_00685 [Myxococcota bacterium]